MGERRSLQTELEVKMAQMRHSAQLKEKSYLYGKEKKDAKREYESLTKSHLS